MESNQKSIKCSLCDVSFANSFNLKRHMLNQHKSDSSEDTLNKNDQLVLNCLLCDYSSVKESSLKIHKTMKHKGNEKFEEKLLISRTLFKKKTINDVDQVINALKCSKCDFSGNDEKELRYHRFRTHRHAFLKRSEKFKCNECDQSFYDDERLKSHKESDHSCIKIEKGQEILLVEEPEPEETETSLEVDDSVMSIDENDAKNDSTKDERNERLKVYNDKKAEF